MTIAEQRRARPRVLPTALAAAGLLCVALLPAANAADATRHEPVTGTMLDGASAPAPATTDTDALPDVELAAPAAGESAPPLPAYADEPADDFQAPPVYLGSDEIGDTTRHLLKMQADNSFAGPPRPMLGAEAAAAYQRYLDSFNHPIPEFFETNVETDSGGGN
jgi:hypothetical protein